MIERAFCEKTIPPEFGVVLHAVSYAVVRRSFEPSNSAKHARLSASVKFPASFPQGLRQFLQNDGGAMLFRSIAGDVEGANYIDFAPVDYGSTDDWEPTSVGGHLARHAGDASRVLLMRSGRDFRDTVVGLPQLVFSVGAIAYDKAPQLINTAVDRAVVAPPAVLAVTNTGSLVIDQLRDQSGAPPGWLPNPDRADEKIEGAIDGVRTFASEVRKDPLLLIDDARTYWNNGQYGAAGADGIATLIEVAGLVKGVWSFARGTKAAGAAGKVADAAEEVATSSAARKAAAEAAGGSWRIADNTGAPPTGASPRIQLGVELHAGLNLEDGLRSLRERASQLFKGARESFFGQKRIDSVDGSNIERPAAVLGIAQQTQVVSSASQVLEVATQRLKNAISAVNPDASYGYSTEVYSILEDAVVSADDVLQALNAEYASPQLARDALSGFYETLRALDSRFDSSVLSDVERFEQVVRKVDNFHRAFKVIDRAYYIGMIDNEWPWSVDNLRGEMPDLILRSTHGDSPILPELLPNAMRGDYNNALEYLIDEATK